MRLILFSLLGCMAAFGSLAAQVDLTGVVVDANTDETLIGASVLIKGTSRGTITDIDGSFSLRADGLPVILQVSYTGYETQERQVESVDDGLNFRLGDATITTSVVEVTGRRISERQQQSALTLESMDNIAIKETPAVSFYDGLGNLKDVDLTAASLGFKIINTRGFNSTNPVRSLQLIDGVDNQSPGLNFSLGNFLGASELDVNRVNLVVGAASAFYGPNAFNGVIAMETRDPFLQQGLSATVKVGERNYLEAGFRWADAFTNKKGQEWMAYKINVFGFRADDWEADNDDPVFDTEVGRDNPGGYDAVNIYGDEANPSFDFTGNRQQPGLGIIRRRGYREVDLVDYDSENLKAGVAFHFRLNPERTLESTELLLTSNYSTGTTVYQGDNRFSLRNIEFFQHRIELRNRDNFFIRAYVTHEDAGDSYDPYFTALRLQELAKSDGDWAGEYSSFWSGTITSRFNSVEGYPNCFPADCSLLEQDQQREEFFNQPAIRELLFGFHEEAQARANEAGLGFGNQARFEPGTARFQTAFDSITALLASEGGTRFFDRSALYHLAAEKKLPSLFRVGDNGVFDATVGGSYRLFTPDSRGTIMSDTMGRNIDTYEYGFYGGGTLNLNNKVRISASTRLDKNQNFDLLFSPAASIVWTPRETTTLRASFSSAIRNPTLYDQYLFYNVGRAILLGNLDGVNDLVTVESVEEFANTGNSMLLDSFNVAPIQPEQVRTLEVGARTTIGKSLFLDATYYYSFYNNFIGFNLGVDLGFLGTNITSAQAFRVAANATDRVTTQGFSIGGNYYFADYFTINANYSWNVLNTQTDDPIIPAFNTPEHKYNIGISGRDVPLGLGSSAAISDFGFSIAYKWVDGFIFEGSPQFTGIVEAYGLLDAQINFNIERINTTIKIGASNVLDNQVFQVYGGPRIGRLAYISATYNWEKR
ncbi:MAG: TonB-dependent receptor [Bacteroidota bacterium]